MPLLVLLLLFGACEPPGDDCVVWPVCFEPVSPGSLEPFWSLDPATGEFDSVRQFYEGDSDPMHVVADSSDVAFVWSNRSKAILLVDLSSGYATNLTREGKVITLAVVRGMAHGPNRSVFAIEAAQGWLAHQHAGSDSFNIVSMGAFFSRAGPVAYDPWRNRVYVAAREGQGALVECDPVNRRHVLLAGEEYKGGPRIGTFPVVTAMVMHPTERKLLLLTKNDSTDIFECDPGDPVPFPWKEGVASKRLSGLAVDAVGERVFTLSGANVYAIDLATAEATLIAKKPDPEGPFRSGASLAFSEPMGLLLFAYD